jgi:hypothetical protein
MTEEEEVKNHEILVKEIESWKGFEYALCKENRFCCLFNKMLAERQDNKRKYTKAADSKCESYL